jgi:hypothetical protein
MSDASDLLETAAPGAFLTEGAPDDAIPEGPMQAVAAMRLVDQELEAVALWSLTSHGSAQE